jgi:hypothetical protein
MSVVHYFSCSVFSIDPRTSKIVETWRCLQNYLRFYYLHGRKGVKTPMYMFDLQCFLMEHIIMYFSLFCPHGSCRLVYIIVTIGHKINCCECHTQHINFLQYYNTSSNLYYYGIMLFPLQRTGMILVSLINQ